MVNVIFSVGFCGLMYVKMKRVLYDWFLIVDGVILIGNLIKSFLIMGFIYMILIISFCFIY